MHLFRRSGRATHMVRVHETRRWRRAVIAVTAVGGLAGTACSAAAPSSFASQSSHQAVANATGASCPKVANPVTNYLAYVCGKKGAANPKLSPVYIGVVNGAQGGASDVDVNASTAATMTINFINQHLGGIDGHPLKEVFCAVPETVSGATQCGQEMANNSKVHVVVVATAVTVGDEAFESALAPTKKLLILFAGGATDIHYKNALWLYGSGTSIEGPVATFLKKYLHAKTVAMIGPTGPLTTLSFDAVIAGLKIEHIKYKTVTYDPSATDLTAPLEASGAATASAIYATVSFTGCSDLELSLKELNITRPVVDSGPLCILPSVAAANGGKPLPWYSLIASPLDSDKSDASGAAYNRVAAEYGQSSLNSDNWMQSTMSEVLTAARFMNEVGPNGQSPAALQKVAFAWHGPMMWGPPTTVCGTVKAAPQICTDEIQVFKPNSAGVFINESHGWIGPPAGVNIAAGT